jgi:hypothetical protein
VRSMGQSSALVDRLDYLSGPYGKTAGAAWGHELDDRVAGHAGQRVSATMPQTIRPTDMRGTAVPPQPLAERPR